MKKIFVIIFVFIVLTLTNVGCSSNETAKEKTPPVSTTTTDKSNTAVEEPSDKNKTIMPLGTDYETVVEVWGEPTMAIEEYKDGFGMVDFKGGLYQTIFNGGKLAHLKVVFEITEGTGQGVALKVAEELAKEVLPKDIKQVNQFDKDISPAVGKAYIYKSESLASMFNKESFGTAEVGTCMAYYKINEEGEVFAVLLALGNNP